MRAAGGRIGRRVRWGVGTVGIEGGVEMVGEVGASMTFSRRWALGFSCVLGGYAVVVQGCNRKVNELGKFAMFNCTEKHKYGIGK